MKVKNDFPNADRVISKLKKFVSYFEQKSKSETDPEEKEIYEDAISLVDQYIDSVEKYLDSVCNSEDRIKKYKNSSMELRDIQQLIQMEDDNRTRYHSNIITTMIMIDRYAEIEKIEKVFDYAEEFQKDYSRITANSGKEKSQMTERERIKRREMGNFGLYIAASVTAGMSRVNMIDDDDAREFASCETDNVDTNIIVFKKVKDSSKTFKKNMEDMIK